MNGTPIEVAQAFARAVANGDESAALSLCTARGAQREGDTVAGLVAQAMRKGMEIEPTGEWAGLDRGVVAVRLAKGERQLQHLWLLLRFEEAAWKLEGVTKAQPHAALFLSGELPAVADWRALPVDAAGRAWAESTARALAAGNDTLDTELADDPAARESIRRLREIAAQATEVAPIAAVRVASVGRVAAGIAFRNHDGDAVSQWFFMQEAGGGRGFVIHSAGRILSFEALLRGVQVDWSPEGARPQETAMAKKKNDAEPTPTPSEDRQMSPDEARQVLEAAVVEAMKNLGHPPGPDGKPDFSKAGTDAQAVVPQMVYTLFNQVIEQAKAGQLAPPDPGAVTPSPRVESGAPVVSTGAPAPAADAATRPLTPAEQEIQKNIQEAFTSYLRANVGKDATEVVVDGEFLQQHGPAMFGAMVQGFFKAIVPEEIKVDVPTEEPGGEPRKVTMKIDVAGMFKGLVPKPAEASNTAPPEPSDDGDSN